MKKFRSFLIALGLISIPVVAQATPVFKFDLDGGKCSGFDDGYAQFGAEGMVFINTGGQFIPQGEFPFADTPYKLSGGLWVFPVRDLMGDVFEWKVDPKGNFTASEGYRVPSDMYTEGLVDVAKFKPCK